MKRLFNLLSQRGLLPLIAVFLCLLGGTGQVWALYDTYFCAQVGTSDVQKGLVYANKSNSVSVTNTSYTSYSEAGKQGGSKSAVKEFYVWAKPARGYVLGGWTKPSSFTYGNSTKSSNNGTVPTTKLEGEPNTAKSQCNSGSNPLTSTYSCVQASWTDATGYAVTFKEPEGGSYTVTYKYLLTKESSGKYVFDTNAGQTLTLNPDGGDKTPVDPRNADNKKSYAADEITLSTSSPGFSGWYEDGKLLSKETTYRYTASKDANIKASFKYIVLGEGTAEAINTTSTTAANEGVAIFPIETKIGTWVAGDFTPTLGAVSGSGSFEITGTSIVGNTVHVSYTYTANDWTGSSVTLTLTPQYGASQTATLSGAAEMAVDYDAMIVETEETGSLAEVLAIANGMNTTPTIKLMRNIDMGGTNLQFAKSMKLDLNSKTLSGAVSSFIYVNATVGSNITLTITDESFNKAGKINVFFARNNYIYGINVTNGNKLILERGEILVENTADYASNSSASVYGVKVQQGGNFVMNGGSITAISDYNAYGILVNAAGDYATLTAGSITAEANRYAYGVKSLGTVNITDAAIDATTKASYEACPVWVVGGATTLTRVDMVASAHTTKSYGAMVDAGKLVMNGGSILATANQATATKAADANVFGIWVKAGATAAIQMQAKIDAIAANETYGQTVYGINNSGSLTMANSKVTATSPTMTAYAVLAAAGSTTHIEGGTYTGTAGTTTAAGIRHDGGTLEIDGGTYAGYSSSALTAVASCSTYGIRSVGNADIQNATLLAESQGRYGQSVYGYCVPASTNNVVRLTNCTITANAGNEKAYALRLGSSDAVVSNSTIIAKAVNEAYAYGVSISSGDATINNCEVTADAYKIHAYGLHQEGGTAHVNGGSYDVTARQATTVASEESKAYGAYVATGLTTELNGAEFAAKSLNDSYSKSIYGLYAEGTANITSNSCSYTASACNTVYGIYAEKTSTLNLTNNKESATATATTTARGIYTDGNFTINGDWATSKTLQANSYALYFGANANGTVLDGRFKALGDVKTVDDIVAPLFKTTSKNVVLRGGYYTDAMYLRYFTADGYDIYGVDDDTEEYAGGYYHQIADHQPSRYVCKVPETGSKFATLAEAFEYAANNAGTTMNIVMTQPHTLPAGDYKLPSNATLIVPYKASETSVPDNNYSARGATVQMMSEYMRLNFADGAVLNVDGNVYVGAQLYVCNGASTAYVQGPYGRIHMENGSRMMLNGGAKLYGMGYITGTGEISAKNGAKVYEMFQIHDMKSAGSLSTDLSGYKSNDVFPVNQYYIQNIEAPVKYYYGAQNICYMGITVSTGTTPTMSDPIKLVGTNGCLFQITKNDEAAWVRKSYDAVNDRQIWETNSTAELGSMTISVNGVTMNSAEYALPITSNMTVHVLSGKFAITQNADLLPGSKIIVDKTGELVVNSGCAVHVYDQNEWGKYSNSALFKPVKYSPSWNNGVCPRAYTAKTQFGSAEVFLHGSIDVKGKLYTTVTGANIHSTNADAGTIKFSAAAATADKTIHQRSGSTYYDITANPARLKNLDGTFAATSGTLKDEWWGFADGVWTKYTRVDDCTVKDNNDVYYAKPKDYVALLSDSEGPVVENHIFKSADGAHLYIQQMMDAGCQWWEVELTTTPGVVHCLNNDFYYTYDTDHWTEKLVNVTFWLNESGTSTKELKVKYNTIPDQSIVANPTKADDARATYQFRGWVNQSTAEEFAWTAVLPIATEDVVYAPAFTEKVKKYTVTFNNAEDGAAMRVEVEYNQKPVCTPTKVADAQYTYTFKDFTDGSGKHYATCDALPVVTGPATYTANWLGAVNVYTVIFKDGEQTLQTKIDQPYGIATAFAGLTPSKDADDEFVYAFDGWVSSQNGKKYANGSTPAVSGDVTYTAHYATTARYFITFANYDGTVLQREATTAGERPVYNGTPRRDADRDGYFRFDGWMDGEGNTYAAGAELPAVSKKQTYTAQWTYVTTRFTVTFKNFDGNNGTWSAPFGEGEIPSYDGTTPLGKPATTSKEYTLDYWVATSTGEHYTDPLPAVSKEETYTAHFAESTRMYTITFVYDGYGNSIKREYAYGATPAYDTSAGDPTPRKDDEGEYSYTFNGWGGDFAPVTGDATYTAQFLQTQHQYTITFVLNNGSANVEQHLYKGVTPSIEAPTKATDAEWIYTFACWDTPLSPVLYDKTYTAQWNQTGVPYNVTFVDEDGTTVLKATEAVAHGQKPVAPANPSKAPVGETFYTFAGWVSSVDGNTYTAANFPAVGTSAVTYTAKYQEMAGVVAVVIKEDESITPYTNFNTALSNVTSGSTLKLMANVSLTASITFNTAMTFDLNGHTISRTLTKTGAMITSKANVTITDSSIAKNGAITASTSTQYLTIYAIDVNAGKLTMNGGNISCSHTGTNYNYTGYYALAYGIYINTNGASLEINDGYIYAYSKNYNAYSIYNNKAITINGGKFNASAKTTAANLFNKANATVTGGFFSSNSNLQTVGYYTIKTLVSGDEGYSEGYRYAVVLDKIDLGDAETAETIDKDYTVPANKYVEATSLTIQEDGSVTVPATSKLIVGDLYLEAIPDKNLGAVLSGDIELQGDAFIDINMNGSGTMNKNYYYSFAVPFNVDLNGGVFRMENGNAVLAKPNTEFRVWTYSEAKRAEGKSDATWTPITSGTLVPGVFYLLQVATNNTNTYRFKWNHTGNLNNHADIEVTSSTTGESTDLGWHGVANNGLGYSTMSGSFRALQTLNSETNAFDVVDKTEAVAMANPVFVQMATGTIDLSTPAVNAAAPRRAAVAVETEIMNVRLYREDADKHDDQIFFSASEEAEGQYTIGKDVSKMFMGAAKKAQLWINAYGQRLVANEAVMNNDAAVFPLSIYAPAAGDYVISLNNELNDNLYLTHNGVPVWNLTMSEYPIHLEAGNTEGYSLVLRRAPQVTTDIEDVNGGMGDANVQKIFYDGKLYIVTGEHVYDAQGKLVK